MNQQIKKRKFIKEEPKKKKIACDYCHNSHKKCDGNKPCSSCISRGRECRYSNVKDFTRKLLYSDVKLYLGSTLKQYLNVYFMTCYPYHKICPENFEDIVPELFVQMIKEKFENEENKFLLYAILANSTLIIHEVSRAEEFYHQCLQMEAKLGSSSKSFVLGCAYAHMSYFCMCYQLFGDAHKYAMIARSICEKANWKEADLWAESMLKISYTTPMYDARVNNFKTLGSSKQLNNKMISILGLIHTELDYKQPPNFKKILDTLYKCQTSKVKGWEFLYNLYVHSLLLYSLRKAGLNKLALSMADKVYQIANNSELPYSCVVVSTFAMREVSKMHLDFGCFDKVDKDLRLIGTLAHYPITETLFHEVSDKLFYLTQSNNPVKLNLDASSVQREMEESKQRDTVSNDVFDDNVDLFSILNEDQDKELPQKDGYLLEESLDSLILKF